METAWQMKDTQKGVGRKEMINNMKENQPIDLAGLEEENGYLA